MTARPTDWSPLCGSDPVPGDWEEVKALGRDIRTVADEIKEQTDKLRNLCTDGYWDSDAGEKFDKTAQETATTLGKAYARYDAAADALEYYYPKLKAEQDESLLILADAQDLETERSSAQGRLDDDEANPPADPEAPERTGAADDRTTVAAYAGKLNALRDKAEACAGRVRNAANTAAEHIESVIDDDGLKDSRLDKIKNWVAENLAPVLKVIGEIAGWVAAAAGLLALAVCWIPVIGQALAGVLGTIALIAGAISLVCNLVLWFCGEGGFGAVLLDMVGLLTFGVGRAAIAGLKGGAAALRATGKLGTAANLAAHTTAARGKLTQVAINAIAKGDLKLASELSGLKLSKLKGIVGSQLGGLTDDFGAGGFKHLKGLIDDAPGKFAIPKLGDFNVGDGIKGGLKDLRDLHLAIADAPPGLLDPGVAASIKEAKNLTANLDHLPSVSSITNSIDKLELQFYGNTFAGMLNDGLGNTPLMDDFKDLGTWDGK